MVFDHRNNLSGRLQSALAGCYEARRAAALSGVPVSTVYYWARQEIVVPTVSPTKQKLWAEALVLRRLDGPSYRVLVTSPEVRTGG